VAPALSVRRRHGLAVVATTRRKPCSVTPPAVHPQDDRYQGLIGRSCACAARRTRYPDHRRRIRRDRLTRLRRSNTPRTISTTTRSPAPLAAAHQYLHAARHARRHGAGALPWARLASRRAHACSRSSRAPP
jgi:hypothetical protein